MKNFKITLTIDKDDIKEIMDDTGCSYKKACEAFEIYYTEVEYQDMADSRMECVRDYCVDSD